MQNDGWIMQPPAGTGVPVGAYQGEFVGVEEYRERARAWLQVESGGSRWASTRAALLAGSRIVR